MSIADEYRDRGRRQRRDNIRWVAYLIRVVLSSAVILVISIALDVPDKVRQKVAAWRQGEQVPPQVSEPEPQRPRPVQKTDVRQEKKQPDRSIAARQRQRDVRLRTPEQTADPEPARQPEDALQNPFPPVTARPQERSLETLLDPAASIDENAGQMVSLDLSKNTTKVPLDELFPGAALNPHIKLLALRDVTLHYELDPSDGIVHAQRTVNIQFPELPNVRIQVAVVRTGNRRFLSFSPQLAQGLDKPLPLTLSKARRIGLQTRRTMATMDSQLAQAKQEKESLQTWLQSRVGKTLQARGNARTRVTVLSKQIPKMETALEAGKKELELIVAMEKLVNQLHDRDVVQVDIVSGDDG